MSNVFSISKPNKPLPLIFDSPHSGSECPADFKYICDKAALHRAEDKFVDDLFSSAPEHGASLLQAHISRCYIDLNRAIDDIDPQLLEAPYPFGEQNPTPRSDAGIGLIWRLIKPGKPIYAQALPPEEIRARIEHYYAPYHDALKKLIEGAHYTFGAVWHINCHSMPAKSAYPKQPIGIVGNKPQAADFCLGNRDGTTCSLDLTRELREFLQNLGYDVTLNDPFKGVEIVKRTADPLRGRHSLQIEINRALYMNEETGEKNSNYNALKADLDKLILFCADYIQTNFTSQAAD